MQSENTGQPYRVVLQIGQVGGGDPRPAAQENQYRKLAEQIVSPYFDEDTWLSLQARKGDDTLMLSMGLSLPL